MTLAIKDHEVALVTSKHAYKHTLRLHTMNLTITTLVNAASYLCQLLHAIKFHQSKPLPVTGSWSRISSSLTLLSVAAEQRASLLTTLASTDFY